jgi:hypothetical protein
MEPENSFSHYKMGDILYRAALKGSFSQEGALRCYDKAVTVEHGYSLLGAALEAALNDVLASASVTSAVKSSMRAAVEHLTSPSSNLADENSQKNAAHKIVQMQWPGMIYNAPLGPEAVTKSMNQRLSEFVKSIAPTSALVVPREKIIELESLIRSGNGSELERFLHENPGAALHRSADGRGPLFWAHESSFIQVANMLKKFGADPHAYDNDGNLPTGQSELSVIGSQNAVRREAAQRRLNEARLRSKVDGLGTAKSGWQSISSTASGSFLQVFHFNDDVKLLRLQILQHVWAFLRAESINSANNRWKSDSDSLKKVRHRLFHVAEKNIAGVGIHIQTSWANINRPGDFQDWTDHGAVTLSGHYYIDDGYSDKFEQPNNDATMRGQVLYIDSFDRGVVPVLRSGFPGTIIMWPGKVKHHVPPHKGNRELIWIAFQIWIAQPESKDYNEESSRTYV